MKSFNTVEEYLAAQTPAYREALVTLRNHIKAIVPQAEEIISYGLPTFKHHYMLVAYGAAAKHCAFYVMSPALMKKLKAELTPYDTATATIRFAPEKPLPKSLIKKIVLERLAENEERNSMRAIRKPVKKTAAKKKPISKK
jgi:uncharacterized protein YdhG (YjbR/CyaY superfamily)